MRAPEVEDAAEMWRLARDAGGLDVSSPYAYLLWCWQFSDTCLVAEDEGRVIGYVTGHRVPAAPERLFVWQLAVSEAHRRRHIGRTLVDALVARTAPLFVEATVTASNHGSRQLLRSWADLRGARFEEGPGLAAELFPQDHEAEHLVRIGPLPAPASTSVATHDVPDRFERRP